MSGHHPDDPHPGALTMGELQALAERIKSDPSSAYVDPWMNIALMVEMHARELKADVWDAAMEATLDWVANNPAPSGIPVDPPANPWR